MKNRGKLLQVKRKIIQLQQEYKKLPKNEQEHGIAKAERKKINRLLSSLQLALKF